MTAHLLWKLTIRQKMALELANPAHLGAVRPQQLLRSGLSLKEAYVLFTNTTQRNVNLYWIDYRGQHTFYLTLRPGFSTKVNTFQSHPWIFRDHFTGERMQVAHEFIYWPKRFVIPNPRNPGELIPCRMQISIHFPVRALRETCLWGIMRSLRLTAETIEEYCIPRTIKTDLKLVLRAIENHRGVGVTTGR